MVLLEPTLALGNAPAANAQPSWSPGHSTTAELQGEVATTPTEPQSDGVYGRFAGDLALALMLGAEVESKAARGLAQLTAHYYWTAGAYFSYRDALDGSPTLQATRLFSTGIDMRPLFIPRWSSNWQTGPGILDLFIDSISVAGGVWFAQVASRQHAQRRGFEASLGAGIPLVGRAAGPWLSFRYAARWPEAGERVSSIWLMLGWHLFASTALASSTGALN